jgi:hypothetical protein
VLHGWAGTRGLIATCTTVGYASVRELYFRPLDAAMPAERLLADEIAERTLAPEGYRLISPDGRRLLYSVRVPNRGVVWTAEYLPSRAPPLATVSGISSPWLAPRAPVELVATLPLAVTGVAVAPGDRMYYLATDTALLVYDRDRRSTVQLARGRFGALSLSREGDRLAVVRTNPADSMDQAWVLRLNPRTGAADGVLRRLSARPIIDVSLSPDGREAALLSEGQDSLWVVSELPGNERLVSAGFLSVPMRWSPDGKSIYLASWSLSGAAVVRVGASGGPAEAVVSGAIGPGLTVDGRHVVQMEPSTGAFSAIVNVHSLAEGAVRSLLVSLPYTPVAYSWSPRGMNLVMALSAPGGTMLVAVDLDGAKAKAPPRMEPGVRR